MSDSHSLHATAEEAPQKIVKYDEYFDRMQDLRARSFRFTEGLFDAFVNTPYNMMLYVRRGLADGWRFMTNTQKDDQGTAYIDRLNGGLFIDRAAMESDNAYALRHGLSKRFQEKAARLSRQAFDECRDFSALRRSGQLEPFLPPKR